MKLLIFFLNIITFGAAFLNSTVILSDKNKTELGYGMIVAPDTIIVQKEDVFYREVNLKFFNTTPEYAFLSKNVKKIGGNAFLSKMVIDSKATNGRESIRISRYPLCNDLNLETVYYPSGNGSVELLSENECKTYYQTSKNQICGRVTTTDNTTRNFGIIIETSHQIKEGSPLIKYINSVPHLIGFSTKSIYSSPPYVTLFQLLVETNQLPVYDSCKHLELSNPQKFLFCNSLSLSKDLAATRYPGIIIIGSAENRGHFVPSGFAVVISENDVIVFSDFNKVLEQFDNYEIFGNGEKKDIAFLVEGIQYFLDDDFNVTNIGNSNLKLLKAVGKPFESFQKASFLFDEKFAGAKNSIELETMLFIQASQPSDQKLVIQTATTSNAAGHILVGTPIFYNGSVVGFQENGSYISVMEIKEFLMKHIPNLIFEEPSLEVPALPSSTISDIPPATTETTTSVTSIAHPKPSDSNGYPQNHCLFLLTIFAILFKFD